MRKVHLFILLFLATVLSGLAASIAPKSREEAKEVFFLLGMHIEYMGKFKGHGDVFFSNEAAKYELYMEHVRRLQEGLGFSDVDQVWQIVDSYYRKEGKYFSGDPVYFISEDVFTGRSDEEVLAYLEGVFARRWIGDCLNFANGGEKPKIVAMLLRKFDCRDVKVESFDEIPRRTEIRFEASKQIEEVREKALRAVRAKEKPNKAPEPTATAVTSPAAQEPRQP